MYRVGLGYDIHKLVSGRDLIIGGVKIPFDKGLEGHSDADALCHAIIDAMLGAMNLGDIGQIFPDTDPLYKDANSLELLKIVYRSVTEKGYELGNLDCNVIIQAPKLMPYMSEIKNTLADALGVSEKAVSVKAKTNEKMEVVGESKAVKANCIVMMKRTEEML